MVLPVSRNSSRNRYISRKYRQRSSKSPRRRWSKYQSPIRSRYLFLAHHFSLKFPKNRNKNGVRSFTNEQRAEILRSELYESVDELNGPSHVSFQRAGNQRSIYLEFLSLWQVPHHIPVPVPVNHPIAVPYTKLVKVQEHVPIEVSKPVPVAIHQQIAIPVPKAVPVPQPIPVPHPVTVNKPVFYPVPHPFPYQASSHSEGGDIGLGGYAGYGDHGDHHHQSESYSSYTVDQESHDQDEQGGHFQPSQPDYNSHRWTRSLGVRFACMYTHIHMWPRQVNWLVKFLFVTRCSLVVSPFSLLFSLRYIF